MTWDSDFNRITQAAGCKEQDKQRASEPAETAGRLPGAQACDSGGSLRPLR